MVAPPPDRPTKPLRPQKRGGAFSLLDAFIESDNPFADAVTNLVGGDRGARGVAEAAGQGWDFAGKMLGTALGRGSTPSGVAIGALEASAKGARITEEDLQAKTAETAAKSPMGATGFIAPAVAGMAISDKVYDETVNRPLSTALLLTDTDSPLWNGKKIQAVDENGNPIVVDKNSSFFDKVGAAYERSNQVSWGQALAANDLIEYAPIGGLADKAFKALGGIDEYDPWDNDDMAAAQDNPFYVFYSGTADLAGQILIPLGIRGARIGAMKKVGWTNTVRGPEDFAQMRQDFATHSPKTPTGYGLGVDAITASRDPILIRQHPLVANNVGANKDRLSNLLAETTDRDTVNEIILANMGDVQALQNLAASAPDAVGWLAEIDNMISASQMSGAPFRPVGPELGKVNQMFDSALARNEYFGTLREELMTPDGRFRVNSSWRPVSGPASARIEAVRTNTALTQYAIRTGDYSMAPQWVQKRVSGRGGRFTTTAVQWMGSKQPLGNVSMSGARPDEKLTELNAQFDTVPELRGVREIKYRGRVMTSAEFRRQATQRIIDAPDAALPDVWREIEDTVVEIVATARGVEPSAAKAIADAYRRVIGDQMEYLRSSQGYLFDAQDGRVWVDQASMSQMLQSFQTLPLAEVTQDITSQGSELAMRLYQGQDIGIAAYDNLQKVFRVNVLFRPGYAPKNSMMEPLISRFIAQGTIFTDEGLLATARNFVSNRVNNAARATYAFGIRQKIDARYGQQAPLRERAEALVEERDEILTLMDEAMSEMDWAETVDVSPAQNVIYQTALSGVLTELRFKLDAIDGELDGVLPEWRQVVEPASQVEVRAKLEEFRAILGDNPNYVGLLNTQLDQIVARARARVKSEKEVVSAEVAALERQLALLRANEQSLSEDYMPGSSYDYSGHSVATDGRQRAPKPSEPGTEGDVARGRDYQGLTNKRQIESFESQLDDARARLAAASDEVEVPYSPTELREIERLEATIARVESYAPGREGLTPAMNTVAQRTARMRQMYPNMNEYVDGGMGGVGPRKSVIGYVKVATLRKMHGNPRMSSHMESLGEWDPEKVTDPLMVEFDPATGRLVLGEGNHRLDMAAANGEEYVPVRVVRSRISDSRAAELEADPDAGVLTIDVPESPWKGGMGEDYWPPNMHPGFIMKSDVLDTPEMYDTVMKIADQNPRLASVRAKVDELQEAYDKIVKARQDFKPGDHRQAVADLGELAAALDQELAEVNAAMRARQGELRQARDARGQAGWSGTGQDDMEIMIGGRSYTVPAAFSQRATAMGEGYRAESSALQTQSKTLDPSAGSGRRQNFESSRWQRSVGPEEVAPGSPVYFDELAYVGNRYFRNDRLIAMHLRGASRETIAAWLLSPAGRAYQRKMGHDYLAPLETYDRLAQKGPEIDPSTAAPSGRSAGRAEPTPPGTRTLGFEGDDGAVGVRPTAVLTSLTTRLDEVLRVVDQYFPDEAVRKTLAEREVTAGDLQAGLGGRTDLSTITGDNLAFIPKQKRRITQAFSNALDKMWTWIAANPEDRLARWPFMQTEFRQRITQRAEVLERQGVRLDDEQFEAIRQASLRESLDELEKTFYNIRRYGTPVYASRFLMSFPGAFFNSIYRYGRFLVKEPERVFMTANLANDILSLGAVNEEGEPVESLLDAKYFLIPGTKTGTNPGTMIPISSFTTLTVGYPGLSVGVTTAASLIQRQDAAFESKMKSIMGDNAFEQFFPFGVSDNPLTGVTAGYQKDLYRYLRGEDDVDVMRATIKHYANAMYSWEANGSQGERPTLDDSIEAVQEGYGQSAFVKWVSPFGIIQGNEGQMMQEGWADAVAAAGGDTRVAREIFTDQYGEAARWFTYSGNNRTAYIPPTQEAYNRIFVDNPEIAKELVKQSPNDPEFVSLLAYGTDGEYSSAVNDALERTPLPGDSTPALSVMNPTEYESSILTSQGWDKYSAGKVISDAEIARLKALRDSATNSMDRARYSRDIENEEYSFQQWTELLKNENPVWAAAKTDKGSVRPEKAALTLKTILQHPDFKDGDSPEWRKVSAFLTDRERVMGYLDGASDEEKRYIKTDFIAYVQNQYVLDDPVFSAMYDRYFAGEWE